MNKLGRNEKCTCGSGIKFKKCCMGKPFYGPVRHFDLVEVQNGLKAWIPISAWAIANGSGVLK